MPRFSDSDYHSRRSSHRTSHDKEENVGIRSKTLDKYHFDEKIKRKSYEQSVCNSSDNKYSHRRRDRSPHSFKRYNSSEKSPFQKITAAVTLDVDRNKYDKTNNNQTIISHGAIDVKNTGVNNIGFRRTNNPGLQKPISLHLSKNKLKNDPKNSSNSKKLAPRTSVKEAFNDDDDEEVEEKIPPAAKMRMRNLGKYTPTASGPNSYGKGGLGFCDRRKIFEKELKERMDEIFDKECPPR